MEQRYNILSMRRRPYSMMLRISHQHTKEEGAGNKRCKKREKTNDKIRLDRDRHALFEQNGDLDNHTAEEDQSK